jgi:hypothetical protein
MVGGTRFDDTRARIDSGGVRFGNAIAQIDDNRVRAPTAAPLLPPHTMAPTCRDICRHRVVRPPTHLAPADEPAIGTRSSHSADASSLSLRTPFLSDA